MTTTRAIVVGALCWLAAAAPVVAETHRVDDSQSQVLGRALRLKPIAPYSRGAQANVVAGDVTVLVRLDVAAWKGHRGRIYMTLPEQAGGTVTATWTTRGQLMPGVVRTGGRTLVYSGLVRNGLLEDTLRLNLQADERRLPRDAQLTFAFEIDLDSP